MALNIAALLMLIFVTGVLVYAIFSLGGLPGRIASERNHPQGDAIRIMGWLGLLTGGLVWAVALCWAYVNSKPAPAAVLPGAPESAKGPSLGGI